MMRYCNVFSMVVAIAMTTTQQSSAFVVPSSTKTRGCSVSGSTLRSLPYEAGGMSSLPPSPVSSLPSSAATGAGQQQSDSSPLVDEFLRQAPMVRRVQGDTLKTWDFPNPDTSRVQVGARGSVGRPVTSRIEYWHTPSYIPFQVTAYTEDGLDRPIDCIIETPKHPKSIAMYNTASQQMPFDAAIYDTGMVSPYDAVATKGSGEVTCEIVQGGGMVKYYTFGNDVDSIAVYIRSPEYNMKAKLELTTGPNSVRQTYEVYCSSGYKTPFYAVLQTPGDSPHTLRVINQNSVEFPFDIYVMPYKMNDGRNNNDDNDDRFLKPRANVMGSW